jgi:predicted secreted Zn-dependent protease
MESKSSSTASELEISDRLSPYFITGATALEILHCVRVAGPRERGRHFAAWTSWRIRWSVARTDGEAIALPIVGVDIVTRLPRWIPVTAPPELAAAWSEFEEGIVAHEAGHRDVAIETARTIGECLRASSGREDAAIRDDVDAILARAHEAEKDYDEHTRHGAADPRVGALSRLAWVA